MRRTRVIIVAGCAILLAATTLGLIISVKTQYIGDLLQAMKHRKNDTQGVTFHGNLRVVNGALFDQHGQSIQLRGVSSHGILWYPQFGSDSTMRTLHKAGANTFRIAVYTTESRGYDKYPEEAMKTTKWALDNVLGEDMYAIVDWHVLSEKNPNVYLDGAIQFFDTISSVYAHEPGVIYEICNEPNGDTSWNEIKEYANQVIPVIRKNAPKAIILVGTPAYSTRIKDAANDPLAFENILYTYHYYADLSQSRYEASLSYAKEKNIGVFVSEWGVGSNYNEETFPQLATQSTRFLDYLDKEGISWISWALSNKNEGHALLKPATVDCGDWRDEDLTDYGRFVLARLGGGDD